jgi:hypothetical protein
MATTVAVVGVVAGVVPSGLFLLLLLLLVFLELALLLF